MWYSRQWSAHWTTLRHSCWFSMERPSQKLVEPKFRETSKFLTRFTAFSFEANALCSQQLRYMIELSKDAQTEAGISISCQSYNCHWIVWTSQLSSECPLYSVVGSQAQHIMELITTSSDLEHTYSSCLCSSYFNVVPGPTRRNKQDSKNKKFKFLANC